MIRHIALFTFNAEVTPGAVGELTAALTGLVRAIPEIESFTCGPDLGITQEAYDYAVVADFATPSAYRTYAEHPEHLAVIRDVVAPLISDRVRIQIEI
jgi:Stress responsive A/B Barrel Domain